MHRVYLGIGSNIDREENIRSGIAILSRCLSDLVVSPVYESHAVGFDGYPFLNLVVSGETELKLKHLAELLRGIETTHGRLPEASKFSSRHLDIDILFYDDLKGEFDGLVLPRGEVLEQAFVLKPLSDIAPNFIHPETQQTIAALWKTFRGNKKNVWQSEFQITVADCEVIS